MFLFHDKQFSIIRKCDAFEVNNQVLDDVVFNQPIADFDNELKQSLNCF